MFVQQLGSLLAWRSVLLSFMSPYDLEHLKFPCNNEVTINEWEWKLLNWSLPGFQNKVYPREKEPRDMKFRGRIRVQLKKDDGTPLHDQFPNSELLSLCFLSSFKNLCHNEDLMHHVIVSQGSPYFSTWAKKSRSWKHVSKEGVEHHKVSPPTQEGPDHPALGVARKRKANGTDPWNNVVKFSFTSPFFPAIQAFIFKDEWWCILSCNCCLMLWMGEVPRYQCILGINTCFSLSFC